MLDSFGREIRYLRISVTDRCNLRCIYCMPETGITLLNHNEILTFKQIYEIAKTSARLGFNKIRLTGGEPLLRKNITELVAMLSGIQGIKTMAMTTNGILLAPLAIKLKKCGLHSINVSLDTLDKDRYSLLTRGGNLENALTGIIAAKNAGLSIKINVVVLQDTSENDICDLRKYASNLDVSIQFITRYHLDQEKHDGEIWDRPPKCCYCDRIRLLSNGVLRPCLHGDKKIIMDFKNIEGSIKKAILEKPEKGQVCTDLKVIQIGG